MKKDLCVFAAGMCAGGAIVYCKDRLIGAAKVLFGKAEAVALADAQKLKDLAASEAAKIRP